MFRSMLLPRQVGSIPHLLKRIERTVDDKKRGPAKLIIWMPEFENRVETYHQHNNVVFFPRDIMDTKLLTVIDADTTNEL